MILPSFFTPRYRFRTTQILMTPSRIAIWKMENSVAGRVEFTAVKSEGIKSIILVGCLLHSFKFFVVCGGFVSVKYPQIEYQRVSMGLNVTWPKHYPSTVKDGKFLPSTVKCASQY